MHLKLGTRKSLLAWAQSSWVARELERLNPGLSIELHGIETRGDRIQDVPLQSVEGKDFFVAEIDQALRDGTVDLTVHSMKDLSLERPKEFVTGCVPPRENPRDVIVFAPSALERLRADEPVRIGTSSPRRLENIPPFLSEALPQLGKSAPRIETLEIRGNVNTRLGRLREPEGSARKLDGAVLAFAGLIRLYADEKARVELKTLLAGMRWMILPLAECAAASAQGALAIECRAKDAEIRAALARLHDPKTEAQAARERALLAEWGGGCHQRFGATQIDHPELGPLFYIRGKKPDGASVDELQWNTPASESTNAYWDGSKERGGGIEVLASRPEGAFHGKPVFIAHARAVTPVWARALTEARLWVSGTASWKKLARLGLWVEGSAEGLGFESVAATVREPVLELSGGWTALTHEGATRGWEGVRAVATYRVDARYGDDSRARLQAASYVYWSSASQYDALSKHVQADAVHACGPGKTAQVLRSRGLSPRVFPSAEEWRKWLRIENR